MAATSLSVRLPWEVTRREKQSSKLSPTFAKRYFGVISTAVPLPVFASIFRIDKLFCKISAPLARGLSDANSFKVDLL